MNEDPLKPRQIENPFYKYFVDPSIWSEGEIKEQVKRNKRRMVLRMLREGRHRGGK